MLLMNTYNLWYNGASQHELHAVGKAKILSNLSNSDSKLVADWALERLGAFDKSQDKINGYKANVGIAASNVAGRYIEHIHRNCAADIKQNMEQYPVISDDEAAKILFDSEIKDELDEIAKAYQVVLRAD